MPTSSGAGSANEAKVHPQQAIHAVSLLTTNGASTVQQFYPAKDGAKSSWSPAAQAFWLNASKGLNWFEQPTVVSSKLPTSALT